MASKKNPRAKKRSGWLVLGFILGALVLGGILARWSPVALGLALLLAAVAAVLMLIGRPLPVLGQRSRRSGFATLGLAVLLAAGGGVAGAATKAPEPPTAATRFAAVTAEDSTQSPARTPKATRTPAPSPTPTTFKTVVERTTVPFERTTVEDGQLDQGLTVLATAGADGVTATTYRVTYVNGVETAREVISEAVETAPVTEVTSIGTRVAAPVPLVQQEESSGCHPSYAGVCVPFASDVDCAGGGGNGPAYVSGPLQVIGHDEYKLDRDGDGIACD